MFESCNQIRECFSDYIDGACARQAVLSIRYHLRHCGACAAEFERYGLMREDVRTLPRPKPSPVTNLRLNVALSQAQNSSVLGPLRVRFENVLRPLLLPATGAVLAGLICFGVTLECLIVPPARVDASTITTPARIESLAPLDFNTGTEGVVLDTHVNADGQVVEYKILSGTPSPDLKPQLDRLMYFGVFRPATRLGQPTDSELVLSLRRITVRGRDSAAPAHNGDSPGPSQPPAERSSV
ncbi:MAG TPA: zf-HC2 domain-containing protein [Terriglobia bacterium]|nr:zf-HC2 domain-containing protein [Terriglobia bacterium]